MTRTIVPDVFLGAMRGIADDEAPPPRESADETRASIGEEGLGRPRGPMRFEPPERCPVSLEAEKLSEAQRLFAAYRTEIAGALLLAALPQSYAASFGAGVLAANGQLQDDLVRRIRRTTLFLLTVMQQAFDDRDQDRLWNCEYGGARQHAFVPPARQADLLPWEMCVDLRGYHQIIRDQLQAARQHELDHEKEWQAENGTTVRPLPCPVTELLGDHNAEILNQEDLLGMMLTFSITVFEVLELYGISWTADQQESYLHIWDVVGGYLGIGTPTVVEQLEAVYASYQANAHHLPPGPLVTSRWHGLRPPSVDDARVLLGQIRARQWTNPTPDGPFELQAWTSLRAGRILTRALLNELQAAMPGFLALEPITVMRALAPDVVRSRLNLGNNGLVMGALARLPAQRVRTDRFTVFNGPNVVAANVLRRMANDVTTRVAARFIEDDDYVLPDFGDWSTEGAWRG